MSLDQEALKRNLIETFRLEGIAPEKQEALLSKMGEALLRRIFLVTMERIGDDGVKEYETLLDRGANQTEIEAFFEKRIPGYNVFVEDAVKEFKEEIEKGLV